LNSRYHGEILYAMIFGEFDWIRIKPVMNNNMPETKLILLEGVPGSGKSMAGAHLQIFLEQLGIPVRFWHEGDFDNPADFEGIARLNTSQYRNLIAHYPGLARLLEEQLTVRGDDHLIKYRKLQDLHLEQIPSRLIVELSGYDVYDGLPMKDYCRLALQRWQDFQASAAQSDEITILECCFLQNPLTVMLARHNADPDLAREQVEKISRIIESLMPLVLYLKPRDVRAALLHAREQRPREWADFVTWYLTGQAYGQAHRLEGYEGVIRFYEMRQKLEVDLLKELPVRSLVIEHTGTEWDDRYREIMAFVSPYLRA
jgi:hypothetical protein